MVKIGLCTMGLFIGEAGSLKDKRRVLKSLLDKIRNRYNVSAAEVGEQDLWQRSTIAFTCVSNDSGRLDQLLSAVVKFVDSQDRVQITEFHTEII
jgi:uncharacterized protein YlxP (DUF503 family)